MSTTTTNPTPNQPAPGTAHANPAALDWIVCAALALMTLLVFLPGSGGEFVYDDQRQIVANALIQQPGLEWRALTSDVWAFNTGEGGSVSNYWRPTFVAWIILHHRLFGIGSAVPWHITNALLHAAVVVLAFRLARRLGLSAMLAAAVAMIFGVHPTRVESVTWISGSPDLLMAIGLLGAMLCLHRALERFSLVAWAGALGLYSIALGSKEAAVLFPAIVGAMALSRHGGMTATPRAWVRAVIVSLPFVALAAAYMAGRIAILGFALGRTPPDAPGPIITLLTMPVVGAFYLRQLFFPVWLSPTYAWPVVGPGSIGLFNFVIPALIVGGLMVLVIRAAWRGGPPMIAAALALVPFVPALNIAAFLADRFVADRYLYLPLLGVVLLLVPMVDRLLARRAGGRSGVFVLAGAGVVSVLLSVQTIRYSLAWRDAGTLWTWATAVSPGSAFGWFSRASVELDAGRADDAQTSIARAISIREDILFKLVSGEVAIERGEHTRAERELRELIGFILTGQALQGNAHLLHAAYERLAKSYELRGMLPEAERELREARTHMPRMRASLSEKIAVMLYQQNRKEEALRELEEARDAARTELQPAARLVFFRLGQLYTELGQRSDARAAFEEFLLRTAGTRDRVLVPLRADVEAILSNL